MAFFYGTPDITEAGTKVAVDPEGNFLLTGQRFSFVDPGGSVPTNSDASVLKIDPLGALLWSNHIDSTITDAAVSVIPRSANNQVVLARSCEALVSGVGCGQNNVRLYFLTNGGNVSNISDHYLGSNALPANFVATPDGGFLICGVTNTYSANSDIFVIKTNAVGEQEWEAIIPGTAPRAFDLVLANDGGCYVAGSSVESAGRVTLFSRISAEGSVQWVKYFGEAGFTGKMARIGSHFGLLLTNAPTDFYGIELYLLDTEGEVVWEKDLAGGFWTTLLRGIFAGWLIALMVWLLPFAETARVGVIIIITYLIGIGEFPHIIAGSIEVLYLVVIGEATWSQFITTFFLPTLLGNTIGGVTLVAAINYAQVASDQPTDRYDA